MRYKKTLVISIGLAVLVSYIIFFFYVGSTTFLSRELRDFNKVNSDLEMSRIDFDKWSRDIEKVCDAMSPFSYYFSTGSFGSGDSGQTYYYKSYCYFELATRTNREDICKKVKGRWSPFANDFYNEKNCIKNIALGREMNLKQSEESKKNSSVVNGAMKISQMSLEKITEDSWRASVITGGDLFGEYRFDVKTQYYNQDTKKILISEKVSIKEPSKSFSWIIKKSDLIGQEKSDLNRGLNSVGVDLYYVIPEGTEYSPGKEYLSGFDNRVVLSE